MLSFSTLVPLHRKVRGQGHTDKWTGISDEHWLMNILPTHESWHWLRHHSLSRITGAQLCSYKVIQRENVIGKDVCYLVFLGSHGINLRLTVLWVFCWILQLPLLTGVLQRQSQLDGQQCIKKRTVYVLVNMHIYEKESCILRTHTVSVWIW